MEIPRHWRLKKQRYGLVGEVVPGCGHQIFPPRDVCPECPADLTTINSNAEAQAGRVTRTVLLERLDQLAEEKFELDLQFRMILGK